MGRAPRLSGELETIHVGPAARRDPSPATPDSPLSSSVTLSEGTPKGVHTALEHPFPGLVHIDALNAILNRREDQLVNRILAHLSTHHIPLPLPRSHSTTNDLQPANKRGRQGSELEGDITAMDGTYAPPLPHHGESASAGATMDSVEMLFPGVEHVTLMQIIENRFKPTNIYRLLASEKDRAESQRVISIGGVSFEQGEREGKESEYRMGPFFKAWAAYCGILTTLAPTGLQGDLACVLFINTMNLHDLLEWYAWEEVKAYHFQFHRNRIASGKEVLYPEDWRKIDAELISSKCFLFPAPNINRNWGSARGLSLGRGQHLPIMAHNQQLSIATAGPARNPSDTIPPPDSHSARGALIQQAATCRNWNYRECRMQPCHYLHSCISCGGNHRAAQCASGTRFRAVTSR